MATKRAAVTKKKLLKLLDEALDHQLSNRGTESVFYNCYTYGRGKFPKWALKAEKILREATHARD